MIYFIADKEHNKVKIGYSQGRIGARLSQLQSSNPFELSIIGELLGNVEDEKRIHNALRHLHVRGEWFELTEDIAKLISNEQLIKAAP